MAAANPRPPKTEYAGPLNSGLPGDRRSICAGSNWQKTSWRWPKSCTAGWAPYPNWSRSVRRGSPVAPKRSPILWPVPPMRYHRSTGTQPTPLPILRPDRTAIREFGRFHGYVTTIVAVLQHRLDGRRLAGVKKRLESLDQGPLRALSEDEPASSELRIDHLYAAEGYLRALNDSLRV